MTTPATPFGAEREPPSQQATPPGGVVVTPLSRRAGDLVRHPLVSCEADLSVQSAARRMVDADTDALVVVDERGRAVGILTDADLRERVVAAHSSTDAPVSTVMSAPVVVLSPEALALEAVQLMLERGIHHVVLANASGEAMAVLSDGDILSAEADRPLLLARRIEHAETIAELRDARSMFPSTALLLLESGASAEQVGAILAEANDRIARRLLEFAELELGPAPGPYCWLAMGSEGRREQTLATDQDNGLVYDDAFAGQVEAEGYFARLAAWMVEALEAVGAERCLGDVMATNPVWRGPLAAWQERFAHWLADPEPSNVLDSLIGFDFRAVAGHAALEEQLKAWLAARTPQAATFLAHVAHAALGRHVPLGFFGRFVLSGEGTFNLKNEAIGPMVDASRLLALEHGWFERPGTLERLDRARDAEAMPREDAQEVRAAFEAIQELRLRHQLDLIEQGHPPDNALAPNAILRAERAGLREHLKAISRFQEGLRARYSAVLRGF